MLEKHPAILVVGPGPALRWAMEELKRRYDYHLIYASTAYDAGQLLENTAVDAVVGEVAPSSRRSAVCFGKSASARRACRSFFSWARKRRSTSTMNWRTGPSTLSGPPCVWRMSTT